MADTVLITGCSTGIGEATARLFLANEWEVYATARDPADLEPLAALGAKTERLDVTVDGAADRAVERVVAEAGTVDCLVNNAGYGQLGPVEDVPVGAVRDEYEVNVFGPHRLVRAAAPYMRRRGGGTIINLSSYSVRFPFAGTGAYSGSKAALATMTRTLRQELADHDVDVVLVEPAFVATNFFERMREEMGDLQESSAYDALYRVLERTRAVEGGGIGVAEPEQVARTVVRAAHHDDPKDRYTVGALATAGDVLNAVIPRARHDALLTAAIRALTSAPSRKLLAWWARRRPPRAEPTDLSDEVRPSAPRDGGS